MILLSAEKVYKGYSERQLLDGCSLAIGEGEKIGLIGINGTGKSTLLKVMAGIAPPDSGIVTRAGGVRVAYLPQNPLFDGETTVLQQVMKGVAIDVKEPKMPRSSSRRTNTSAKASSTSWVLATMTRRLHSFPADKNVGLPLPVPLLPKPRC